jgi:uncharacterized membrane protein
LIGRNFHTSDFFQQIVGGFLLAGPFVVTEEVWQLARGMNSIQGVLTVLLVLIVGYGALYEADEDREEENESEFAGVPSRFVSLIFVAYFSVSMLVFLFSAPTVFEAGLATTLKAIGIGAIFSVVGAATADSVF